MLLHCLLPNFGRRPRCPNRLVIAPVWALVSLMVLYTFGHIPLFYLTPPPLSDVHSTILYEYFASVWMVWFFV